MDDSRARRVFCSGLCQADKWPIAYGPMRDDRSAIADDIFIVAYTRRVFHTFFSASIFRSLAARAPADDAIRDTIPDRCAGELGC